jgi:hypothetical protein
MAGRYISIANGVTATTAANNAIKAKRGCVIRELLTKKTLFYRYFSDEMGVFLESSVGFGRKKATVWQAAS